ncbi:hypothetical protein M569_09401, partial [Genlisea aurea]
IANRLKQFLPQIISENQCAFVPGRLISDDLLVRHSSIKLDISGHKTSTVSGHSSIKLDISKAYDRVDWFFLKSMLLTLGF